MGLGSNARALLKAQHFNIYLNIFGALLSLSACNIFGNAQVEPGAKKEPPPPKIESSNSALYWEQSTSITTGQIGTSSNTVSSFNTELSSYCFDNGGTTCQRATDSLRAEIGSNPV